MGERLDIYLDQFKPRAYQDCLFDAVFKKQYKRIMAIWPRRAGKDLTAWNICIRQLIQKSCVIFYVFPTFALGRRILWDALTIDGYRILDYLPKELIESKNEQLMRIRLINGSLFQVLGSDKFDKSMIGTNAHGMVFSEFAVSEPLSYSLSLPILDSSDGWALIVSTPRGKNFMYDMYNIAIDNPDHWFVSKLTVDDTKHVSLDKILKSRETGEMSEDLQMQEYWTSFDMGVEGSYYIKYIDRLNIEGQIGHVPWYPSYKVHTAWDIGTNDMTSITFFQYVNNNIYIIDCYENNKHGLEHYIKVLRDKPYIYGKHLGPHDMKNMSFSTGMTRWEKAKDLGVIFTIVPKIGVMDGIEAVRTILPRCWFDEQKAAGLLKALQNYRQEYDSQRKVYKDVPYHDIHSNYADSMRYLAVGLHFVKEGSTPEEIEKDYREAMYGPQDNLPRFFR